MRVPQRMRVEGTQVHEDVDNKNPHGKDSLKWFVQWGACRGREEEKVSGRGENDAKQNKGPASEKRLRKGDAPGRLRRSGSRTQNAALFQIPFVYLATMYYLHPPLKPKPSAMFETLHIP